MNTYSTETVTLNTCEMTSILMSKHNIQMGIQNLILWRCGIPIQHVEVLGNKNK